MSKNKRKVSTSLLIAFLANLVFAILEFIGGGFAKSSAVIADAFHDSVDAIILGIALILEKKSEQKPNKEYTYGYKRYSIISAFIMGLVLVGGATVIIYHSIVKLIHYETINVNGQYMMITACVGLLFNGIAYLATKRKKNLNEQAVHLHMLEDWFGLVIVLFGSILIMTIPGTQIIDPILSILASLYIIVHAIIHLRSVLVILLEKTPKKFCQDSYIKDINEINNVLGCHHLHIWQLNENCYLMTMHVNVKENLTNEELLEVREKIEEVNHKFHIGHSTIEFEFGQDPCQNHTCEIKEDHHIHHHHHHHHHH